MRIPQEFRLQSSRVEISRNQDGDLVIHPMPENRGVALLGALSTFDKEFIEILEEYSNDQPVLQDREEL